MVIFSQWERMTRLVAIILKEKNIGFEYLHGGIPGKTGELFMKISPTTKIVKCFYQPMPVVWGLIYNPPLI